MTRHSHRAHYVKIWRYPQNRKYIPNVLCLLTVAVVWSSSGGVVIRYVPTFDLWPHGTLRYASDCGPGRSLLTAIALLPPPKKEVMFLVWSVCLFVCLSVCLSVCLTVRRITRKLVNRF